MLCTFCRQHRMTQPNWFGSVLLKLLTAECRCIFYTIESYRHAVSVTECMHGRCINNKFMCLMSQWFSGIDKWYVQLLQRHIEFGALTELQLIAEGGFGVIHRAKHREWGTVVYKELKSSVITDGSRFDSCTILITVPLMSQLLVKHRTELPI